MSTPFLGQLQAFGFGFAPVNWALCNGQTLSIAQYSALFALIGTYYGGNGTTNFLLPNLQSRVPMHQGTSPAGNLYNIGQVGGEENVTLNLTTLPAHTHAFVGSSGNGNSIAPEVNGALANVGKETGGSGNPYYAPNSPVQGLNPASLAPVGGNQPHANIQPYLAINWCIAMVGIFPSRG
jgi:microcystin-dependent protein